MGLWGKKHEVRSHGVRVDFDISQFVGFNKTMSFLHWLYLAWCNWVHSIITVYINSVISSSKIFILILYFLTMSNLISHPYPIYIYIYNNSLKESLYMLWSSPKLISYLYIYTLFFLPPIFNLMKWHFLYIYKTFFHNKILCIDINLLFVHLTYWGY